MRKIIGALLIVLSVVQLLPPSLVSCNELARDSQLMTRVFGFKYPLDPYSEYKVSWIGNFDTDEIAEDFAQIKEDFPEATVLQIAIDWRIMNDSRLLPNIQTLLELGETYDLMFHFVLMDWIGGELDDLYPWNLNSTYWDDHEERITNVVSPFVTSNQIYAWALLNEPNPFSEVWSGWFEHFIPFIKDLDDDTPISTSFYELGENSSTVRQAERLYNLGLDFIEWHCYPRDWTNITRMVDVVCASVYGPIYVSEFGVWLGHNTYSTATNQRIIQEQIEEFEKRPNVIGMNYFIWSDGGRWQNWSVWDSTNNRLSPEGETVQAYYDGFLEDFAFPYLIEFRSTNSTTHTIYDPSFETLIEYPETAGWVFSSNHTTLDIMNMTEASGSISADEIMTFDNGGFEAGVTMPWQSWSFWKPTDWGNETMDIVTDPVNEGTYALELRAEYNSTFAGHALEFDGLDDFVEIESSPTLEDFDELTITFWMNASVVADGSNWRNVLQKGWNTEGSFVVFLHPSTGVLYFQIQLDGAGRSTNSDSAIVIGELNHVVCMYDGDTVRMWINGTQQSANTVYDVATFTNSANLTLSDSSTDFNGTLDEVTLWRRALNQTEINYLFNLTQADDLHLPNLFDLDDFVGRWSMNEGIGADCYDGTGYLDDNGEAVGVGGFHRNDGVCRNGTTGGYWWWGWVDGIVPVLFRDTQFIHDPISVNEHDVYSVAVDIQVNETLNGAYAMVGLYFRDAWDHWLRWDETEYMNITHDWVRVYVTGIAPENATNLLVACRTRALESDQNITAHFDNLVLREIDGVTYDGQSFAMGWGRGWNYTTLLDSSVSIGQNFTLPNPSEDIHKIWSFTVSMAVVQSEEYDSDWKGSFITLAFTTADQYEWIEWYDSMYLAFDHDWRDVSIEAMPPPNAIGAQMIIRRIGSQWGVMFIDNARLTSRPAVYARDHDAVLIDQRMGEMNFTMNTYALADTWAIGQVYKGAIVSESGPLSLSDDGVDITAIRVGTGNLPSYSTAWSELSYEVWVKTIFQNSKVHVFSWRVSGWDIWIQGKFWLILFIAGAAMLLCGPSSMVYYIKKKDPATGIFMCFTLIFLGSAFLLSALLW